MPYTPTNFLQAETKPYNNYGDLISDALAGYKAAREPKKIAQEERYRDLANKLTQEKGTQAEIENFYLPRKSEADIGNVEAQTGLYGAQTRGHNIKNDIEEALGMRREQANVSGKELENQHQQMVNAIMRDYGVDKEKAEIALKQMQALKAQREAEQANAVIPRDEQGNEIPVPPNAVNIAGLNDATQRYYQQQMHARFDAGNIATQANDALKGILDILDRNPKMQQSLAYIMQNPKDDAYVNKLLNAQKNNDTKTDIDLFKKYSDQVALYSSQTQPGARQTNQLRQMYRNIKPGVQYTAKANRKLANEIIQENQHMIDDSVRLEPFLGSSFYIPPKSRKSNREGNSNEPGMVKIRNKKTGKEETVTREEAIARGAIK